MKYLLLSVCMLTFSLPSFASVGLSSITKQEAHIVIDYNTGKVLSEKNAHVRMYPASLTKVMTLFILFEEISKNEISFDDQIIVSLKASRMIPSKLGLPVGSTITVRDAVIAVIVKSSNDIAYAIAEHISGSEDKFVDIMNKTSKKLGLKNTNFANSHGLPNRYNYTTPYDMAVLARAMMVRHNSYYELFSISHFRWGNSQYSNTNRLLDYHGIDGIKTGYTSSSGYNLVTSAHKNNNRIIAVVMGFDTSFKRNSYMKKIIDNGLISAEKNRRNLVRYVNKPTDLQENYSTQSEELENNFNGANIELASAQVTQENSDIQNNSIYDNFQDRVLDHSGYSMFGIDELKSIFEAKIVKISPHIASGSTNYSLQVGALSSYKSALRLSYNIVNVKNTNYLRRNNVKIIRRNGMYISRFTKLTKSQAEQSCSVIKKHGYDCFVISA